MSVTGFNRRRRELAKQEAQEVKTLADLTKAELFELCEDHGIEVNNRATKAEIIALLEGE